MMILYRKWPFILQFEVLGGDVIQQLPAGGDGAAQAAADITAARPAQQARHAYNR